MEPVAEESTPYPNQTGSGDSDTKLADGEPPLPVSVSIRYSLPPNSTLAQKLNFMRSHPFQPTPPQIEKPSFDLASIYYRKLTTGSVSRSWVTLETREMTVKSILCSICIAFSDGKSQFVSGFTNFRHAHEKIQAHEKSKGHIAAAQAYAQAENCRDIGWYINSALASKRKEQILQNIQVLNRVFEVVKLLGSTGQPGEA